MCHPDVLSYIDSNADNHNDRPVMLNMGFDLEVTTVITSRLQNTREAFAAVKASSLKIGKKVGDQGHGLG